MNIITLTTDFGLDDWFVGTMKGVILQSAPRAKLIDLTHGLPAGDIRAGAFALRAGCRFFPRGTVHVAVVDPGVGGDRKAIAVRTTQYTFIGPDNGVLSWALQDETVRAIHRLENPDWFRQPVSRTFHGRDVFAPVAARLSRGEPIRQVGPKCKDYVRLPWPQAVAGKRQIRGEVLYLDRFGNAVTNVENQQILKAGLRRVRVRGTQLLPIGSHYQAVPPGSPVIVPGSSGYLEIAVNGGHAAKKLKLEIGTPMVVVRD